MRIKNHLLVFLLSLASLMTIALPSYATMPVRHSRNPAGDCADVLVQDYYHAAEQDNLVLDWLNSISVEEFQEADHASDGSLSAQYGPYGINGGQSETDFKKSVDSYLSRFAFHRDEQSSRDIVSRTFDPRVFDAYNTCMNHINSGLSVEVESQDSTQLVLNIRYINNTNEPSNVIYGTVTGGTSASPGAHSGYLWGRDGHQTFGVNATQAVVINSTPGQNSIRVFIDPTGMPAYDNTFSRADAVVWADFTASPDADGIPAGSMQGTVTTPNNDSHTTPDCPNYGGMNDGKYCISNVPWTINTVDNLHIIKNPTISVSTNAQWTNWNSVQITNDGHTLSFHTMNWGAAATVAYKADLFLATNNGNCEGNSRIPVVYGGEVTLSTPKECKTNATIMWKDSNGANSPSMPWGAVKSADSRMLLISETTQPNGDDIVVYKLNAPSKDRKK